MFWGLFVEQPRGWEMVKGWKFSGDILQVCCLTNHSVPSVLEASMTDYLNQIRCDKSRKQLLQLRKYNKKAINFQGNLKGFVWRKARKSSWNTLLEHVNAFLQ